MEAAQLELVNGRRDQSEAVERREKNTLLPCVATGFEMIQLQTWEAGKQANLLITLIRNVQPHPLIQIYRLSFYTVQLEFSKAIEQML